MCKRPLGRPRLGRRIALFFGLSILLLALICALAPSENLWLKTKRELENRGEILDWDKFIPRSVPDEQNLFEHPVAASLLPMKGAPIPRNPLGVASPRFPPGSDGLGFPFSIATLKHLPREEDPDAEEPTLASLTKWFEQWDQSFAQLREAGKRPFARLPGNYTNPSDAPILNFVQIRTLAQVLASRAKLHLLMGDSPAALEDLDTLAVSMKALDATPGTLVSAMIHVAIAGLYIDVVQEGLRENLWREEELEQLGPRLARINLTASVQQGVRAERAAVGRLLSALANRRKDPLYASTVRDLLSHADPAWSLQNIFVRISTAGWVRRNQAHHARLLQSYIDAMDPLNHRVDLNQIHQANLTLNRLTARWSPHTALVGFITPNFSKAAVTVLRNETMARQAAVACAIKRFQLQNNRPPHNLAELVPTFIDRIPEDLFTRKPMAYERTAVGWELSSTTIDPTNPKAQQLVLAWIGK
jgi:hypothetical protein